MGKGIQAAVKAACSITYVSEKLGVSRPTLYKYMEMYDDGQADRLPDRVRAFFDYMSSGLRSEDDAILYFVRGPPDDAPQVQEPPTRVIAGDGRAMIMFPELEDPSSAVVEVMVRMDGRYVAIGEYRPVPGRRFVTVDDLVPGHTFFYRIRAPGVPAGEPVPFTVGPGTHGEDGTTIGNG